MLSSVKSTLITLKYYDEAVARWISAVISPHVVGVAITSIVTMQYADNPLEVLIWLGLLMPLLVVPPLLYVLWLVKKGALEDIFMPRRETRARPLFVLMVWLTLCIGLMRYWSAPRIVDAFVVTTVVLVGILGFVTLFWKISFHGATIAAAVTATLMVIGTTALPTVLLIPLVGWSRVRLARHTTRQVIYGSLVGVLIAVVMVQVMLLHLLQ